MATYRSFEEASIEIVQYIAANWTLTPIAWDNVPHIDFQDVGKPKLDSGQDPYIEIHLIKLPRVPVEVGAAVGGVIKQFGIIQAVSHVRKDTGVLQETEIYDALQTALEFRSISFVSVRDMNSRGPSNREGWRDCLVLFNFDYESARNG